MSGARTSATGRASVTGLAQSPLNAGLSINVGSPRFSRPLDIAQTIRPTSDASGLSGVGAEYATAGFAPQRTISAGRVYICVLI